MAQILIIDDSKMDRDYIITILKKNDLTVEILEASDGEEGLHMLSRNYQTIDLVLLDWQMPKIDGLEFLRGTRNVQEVASVPIVMVTASGSMEAQNCARRVNPNLAGYIVKPFAAKKLIDIVSPYL